MSIKIVNHLKVKSNTILRALRLYFGNRSLLAWMRLLQYFILRIRGKPIPKFLTLAVTSRCQCRCVHCYSEASSGKNASELTTDQLKSVLDQASELGVLEVIFSGGEPLIRKDIFELISYARQRGLMTRLNTNGIRINSTTIAKLKEAGLTRCAVSVDHPDPETHDGLRGIPGLYQKAVSAMEQMIRADLPCQLQTYVTRNMINSDLERLVALGKRMGTLGIYVLFPIASGRLEQSMDQILTDGERERVRKLQDLNFVHFEIPTEDTRCCLFTRSIMYVSAEGEFSPCPFSPYRLGNITAHSMAAMWRKHCAELTFEVKGNCPLNLPNERMAMKRHMESVASKFQNT